MRDYISIRDRLTLYFILIGIFTSMIIGYFAFTSARNALLDRTFDQLISVRIEKKKRIETFFRSLSAEVEQISRSEDVIAIAKMIESGTDYNIDEEIVEIFNRYLNPYLYADPYIKHIYFFDMYEEGVKVIPDSVSCFVEKEISASVYNFDSIFTFSSLQNACQVSDFILTADDQIVFYIAQTIEDAGEDISLILEVSSAALSNIMFEENPKNGLGESGESYLVGSDLLMRSTSRFHDNAVFKIEVATQGVIDGLKGVTGTAIIKDYRNIDVLSSYSPIDAARLNWVILAEIDLEEAMIPIVRIRNNILFMIVMIALIIFGFSYFFSSRFLKPFIELKEAAVLLGQGKKRKSIEVKSNDEIGQLSDAFNKMAEKIEEQRNNLKLERLHSLESLIDGQEKERQRLSREIHDSLGQLLIALKLKYESQSDQEDQEQQKLASLFDHTIDETRRISNNLMPTGLLEFGLNGALKALCEEMNGLSETQVIYNASIDEPCSENTMRLSLYRIVQEALNNAIKYAKADKVEVNLKLGKDVKRLEIVDDGLGFDVDEVMKESERNGLKNIQNRALLLNAKLRISSSPSKGSSIILEISNSSRDEND